MTKTEKFIYKSKLVHNDTYLYNKTNYINSKEKVLIVCRTHGNRYKYNLDNFKNNTSIIDIECKEHGSFKMRVSNHLHGQSCNLCYRRSLSHSNEVYIKKCSEIHCNSYNYDKTNFIKNNTIITITCPKHGDFEQNSRSHLRGNGCQKCKTPNGEIKIGNLLKNKDIKYKTQVIFDGCKYKRNLPFDFYLYEKNICIEYDGKQHYSPIDYFGGQESFNRQVIKDKIKDIYCIDNNIRLFRIRYDENIEEKLSNILNEI
jgi:very-short-patch-repair endonuclease